MGAVRDGGACAEGGCDGDDLGDFDVGCAGLAGFACVDFNAVGALGGEGHRERHQFFVLGGDGSIGHGGFVEGPEGGHGGGRGGFDCLEFREVFHVVHGDQYS